jgi:hypothetical protein
MKKLNELSKKIYISGQRKTQLCNSLVPVIIALAISAVASVAFLNQGSKLAEKNKVLDAQFEIIELLDQWNTMRRIKDLSKISKYDMPPDSDNIFQLFIQWKFLTNRPVIMYRFPSSNLCKKTLAVIPIDMKRIDKSIRPKCLMTYLVIILN